MSAPVTVERYYVPSTNLEGWAVIFIDSEGFFSTVSDYGNYGYRWSNPGMPFIQFLQSLDEDYVCKKLAGEGREYDDETTHKRALEAIRECVDSDNFTEDEAFEERSLLNRYDELCDRENYELWRENTLLPEPVSPVYRIPQQVVTFYKKVWPRFIEQLKERHP